MSDKQLTKWVLAAFVLSLSPWIMATALTWDGTFNASPSNADPLSQGDDRIRDLKDTIQDHAEVEHRWGSGAPDDTGRHREGSAVIWYQNSDPAGNTATDAMTANTAYGANDEGRMLRRSDTGELKVWNGSAWVQALTALSGTVNLINTPLFSKGGADAFDIHAHDGRHRLGGTDGAWTDAADGMPFAIQQVLVDSSVDGAACGTVNTTANASQVFGDAGDACLSISTGLNFTGRTGNSRLVILAAANIDRIANACSADMVVYLDSVATQIGDAATESVQDFAGGRGNLVVIGYTSTVSAAAHEVAVHLSDASDDSCDISSGELIVVDLGNST